jgi:hypothetical protein
VILSFLLYIRGAVEQIDMPAEFGSGLALGAFPQRQWRDREDILHALDDAALGAFVGLGGKVGFAFLGDAGQAVASSRRILSASWAISMRRRDCLDARRVSQQGSVRRERWFHFIIRAERGRCKFLLDCALCAFSCCFA